MSVPSFRFRPLAESDLPTLVEWFAEPEIARWWNQPAEIDSVRAKYVPRIEQRDPTQMWIAVIDDDDGGLLQSYGHVDYPEHDECVGVADAVGIDYLLAGPHRGRGRGRFVLRAFADWTLSRYPNASCCVATPAQANEASWRALEYAGFSRVGECQPPDEPLAYVYVRERKAPSIHGCHDLQMQAGRHRRPPQSRRWPRRSGIGTITRIRSACMTCAPDFFSCRPVISVRS